MTTTTSITSLQQGQLYGAKPTLEELERQLEADPMTRAINRCGAIVATLVAFTRRVKLSAMASTLDSRRQGDGLGHAALK